MMNYIRLILILLVVFCQCTRRTNSKKEILVSEYVDNGIIVQTKCNFKLLSDSTYEFVINEYQEFQHEKNEIFRGRYSVSNDTILFNPFKIKLIHSDKAIIKNNFIEFLNGDVPLKLKIIKTSLKNITYLDTLQFAKYAFFTFDPKFYPNLDKEGIPYDLKTSEIAKIDSIIKSCIKENSIGKSLRTKNYFKQCIAIKSIDNEIVVWVNLLCTDGSHDDYLYYDVSRVNDGGDCFFNLKINLNKLTYYDLYINGSA